jgi:hypothetical protein
VAVSGGKSIKACGRSYFIADTTVTFHSQKLLKFIDDIQETLTDAASFCISMNMSVLSLESISEIFCLLKMIPIGTLVSIQCQTHHSKFIFQTNEPSNSGLLAQTTA